MTIIGISGSARKNSYNCIILKFIQNNFKKNIDFKIIDITKLPMFNEDIEKRNFIAVEKFKNEVISADGIVFVTPEYNYSIPPLLKNALDWGSRLNDNIFKDKIACIISSSLGMLGGARAQYNLRQICVALRLNVLNYPEVFITNVDQKINDQGIIIDNATKERCLKLVNALIVKIEKG